MQDDLAQILLRLAGQDEQIYQLTAEEEADLISADDEAARGEVATDDEVQAVSPDTRLSAQRVPDKAL